jgi:hypothetical protein
MKKIFSYAMMLAAGSLAFISCDADRDSNPTLETPAAGTFVLNSPVYGTALVDLLISNSIALSWSQPQFTSSNAPVTANYEIQLSNAGTFTKAYDAELEDNTGADYIVLDETYTSCKVDVPASKIATALQTLNGWATDNTVFENGITLTVRVRAFVQNATFEVLAEVLSNEVTVNALPYYVELKAADPDIWYLIGGDIGAGGWTSDVPTGSLPLQTVADFEYDTKTGFGNITWTGYLGGNGFKIKHTLDSWDEQIGQGSAFGAFVKNDGGSSNISVPAAGYYTITVDTKALDAVADKDDCSAAVTVEAYTGTPDVFAGMCISGDFNSWGDTDMTPAHTYAGAVNHDWFATVTLDGAQGIKFKEPGSWDYNTGGPITETQDGSYFGYGTNNGDNIYPAAGTYLVIYNDITRYYRFILQ